MLFCFGRTRFLTNIGRNIFIWLAFAFVLVLAYNNFASPGADKATEIDYSVFS